MIKLRSAIVATAVFAMASFGAHFLSATTDGGGDMEAMKNFPADQKAFFSIGGINDPQAKLDAYRKFAKDYPKSMFVSGMDTQILEVLTKSFPSRTSEIDAKIAIALKNDSQGSSANMVAGFLAQSDSLLPRAEKFAKQALEGLGSEENYAVKMKAEYQKAKIPVPDDKKIQEAFDSTRARYRGTLGEIYVKEGKTAEGQKILQECFKLDPQDTNIASQLAALELKAGHDEAAFNYLVPARLYGNTKVSDERELERLYKKTHGDSLAGFQEFLDKRYEEVFPEPAHPEAYKVPASRSDRAVLVELVTGAACPPCVGADVAVDQVIDHYSRKDVVVLISHRQSPRPDPMANWSSIKESNKYPIQGIPSFLIDGDLSDGGGADRDGYREVYDRIIAAVDKQLQQPAEAAIALDASREGSIVKVHVTADKIKNQSPDLRLQVALVERRLRYNGENSIRFHSMVLRNLANLDQDGFAIRSGEPTKAEYSFDVAKISSDLKTYLAYYEENNDRYGRFKFVEFKDAIDLGNLAIVAFVQDSKTKHILQSAYVDVSGAPSSTMGR